MLLSLATWLQALSPEFGFFRVFQYLTFRAVMAAMTALVIGLVAGPWVIRKLTELKIGQPVRGYAMETHLSKSGTPTMGGVLILLSIAISTLLWFDWTNRFVWIVMVVTFGFGAIGWVDDWRKVVNKDPEGMRSREKYFWQSLIGMMAAFYLLFSISGSTNARVWELLVTWIQSGFTMELPAATGLLVPFFKEVLCDHELSGHCGFKQCREFDRWPGRIGHHAGDHGGIGTRHFCLHHRQCGVFQVPVVSSHSGHW
jgi:phospho-N-acetylmuramoyl-pentapeptide-transferase